MLKLNNNSIGVSWWDMSDIIKDLCDRIPLELPLVDSVYGIPRGGLVPAVMISHHLGLPYVETIGKNTLIVDDICDSGVTLDKMPGQFTAVLFHKPHTSIFTPDIWAKEHTGDEWLIFPWENSKSEHIQDYLANEDKFGNLQDKDVQEFLEQADKPGPWPEEYDKIYTVGGLSNDKEGSFMKFMNKVNKNG